MREIKVKSEHDQYKTVLLKNVDFALTKADEKDIRLRTESYLDSDEKLYRMYGK